MAAYKHHLDGNEKLRRLEKIPQGAGIMLDDVGAGLYALAILQAALHFGWLR